jgi:hypothetical protein
MAIWYICPVLVVCYKNNLATLLTTLVLRMYVSPARPNEKNFDDRFRAFFNRTTS